MVTWLESAQLALESEGKVTVRKFLRLQELLPWLHSRAREYTIKFRSGAGAKQEFVIEVTAWN